MAKEKAPHSHAHTPVAEEARSVSSAPELPAAVAKQYGLHDHAPAAQAASEADARDPLLDDTQTDAAVEDIMAEDSDALLGASDPAVQSLPPPKRGFWRRIGHFFAAWWGNKWARYTTLFLMAGGLAAIAALPVARYAVLNTVGVRSNASVVVLDGATRQPLKNVKVSLDGIVARTNVDGVARFSELRLGKYDLTIKRVAFAVEERAITIGWGSNPLGEYKLRATGVQYRLEVLDYLSGKPLAGIEAVSDEANALSDKKGMLLLTVEDTETTTLPVTVQAAGYRSEQLTLDAESEATTKVLLVLALKHLFISKQSGKSDVYRMDLDGRDRSILLAGTGLETSNMSLSPNTEGTKAALVSTRDNVRDKDGYLLSTLTLIDVKTGASSVLDRGAQIQLLGWVGDRLVYRTAVAGASAANSQRYRLIAYNYTSAAKLQLTSANLFTVSKVVRGSVYYAASSNDPKAVMGLYKIKPDGSGKKRLFEQEVWSAFQTSYHELAVQTPEEWYDYDLTTEASSKSSAPSILASRAYVADADDKRAVWVDLRDGKKSLLLHTIATGKDAVLTTQPGLAEPLRWLGNQAIIFRVAGQAETADYAISPSGGEARKLTDVTFSYGSGSE